MWDAQLAPLPDWYTVVRYDIRGFGSSPLPQARYAPVADIAALLDHLVPPYP